MQIALYAPYTSHMWCNCWIDISNCLRTWKERYFNAGRLIITFSSSANCTIFASWTHLISIWEVIIISLRKRLSNDCILKSSNVLKPIRCCPFLALNAWWTKFLTVLESDATYESIYWIRYTTNFRPCRILKV